MSVALLADEVSAAPVFRVALENIPDLWPRLERLVAVELAGIPTHEPADVRRALLANQAHLWIQWVDRVEAMAVTDFVNYPRGMALRVWLGAAQKDSRADKDQFLEHFVRWARRNECRWIEACGRVGWLKIFSDLKYSGMFMRMDVDKSFGRVS